MDTGAEEKIFAQNLLSAATRHDVNAVKNLLRKTSANVQNDSNGFTPLHAAVSSCAEQNTAEKALDQKDEEASQIVQVLLENGAIWNDLDMNDETPGCIAHRLGLKKVYRLIVDAGIRAELLLTKLDELNGTQEGEKDVQLENLGSPETQKANENSSIEQHDRDTKTGEVFSAAAASRNETAEFPPPDDYLDYWDSNDAFLRSSLRYTDATLLDHSSNAVMMDWETEIMNRHADTLLPTKSLRAMNIGHGMGIVDTAIQAREPTEHHIVEAHPAVLEQMQKKGWFDKPGVVVHKGRWQDVLPRLVEQGVVLDAVYYDTFAEDYKDLRELFSEHVIGLLDQEGRFGFYNGMGADRLISYDVYQGVVNIDLAEAGYKTEWEDIPVPKVNWKGVRRPYWNVDTYRLPVCKFS